jgi:hypothetical protein
MVKKIIGIILVLIVIAGVLFLIFRMNEDSWIKDEKGRYIKHGNPESTPEEVLRQQQAISCASELYASSSLAGVNFSSQCLGGCDGYAIDIVHSPRTNEDNLIENQCSLKTNAFIELNKDGRIVRIVD